MQTKMEIYVFHGHSKDGLSLLVILLTIGHNKVFYTYSSRDAILEHLMNGKLISGYHHPQYPKHVIVAYW